jgi:hypothetical protein
MRMSGFGKIAVMPRIAVLARKVIIHATYHAQYMRLSPFPSPAFITQGSRSSRQPWATLCKPFGLTKCNLTRTRDWCRATDLRIGPQGWKSSSGQEEAYGQRVSAGIIV